MNAQDFRSLQEAYLDVVENQQIDEASGGIIGGKTFPSKNVPEKSKPNKPSKIGKGIRKSIHSASFGLSQEKPKDIVSRHREYTDKELDTVSRSGDEPKPEKGRSRSAREFQLKVIEREKRRRQKANEQTDLYDIILSHLLDEGYAETPQAAEVIMVNMSEDWRESICEEYKKLPVGKMIKQAAYKAYYASKDDGDEKVDKQVAKMTKVADTHNPNKSKRKEDDNRREGGRKRDAGRPRSNELQDNW